MPAPSGQIPPPWARWENKAPTARVLQLVPGSFTTTVGGPAARRTARPWWSPRRFPRPGGSARPCPACWRSRRCGAGGLGAPDVGDGVADEGAHGWVAAERVERAQDKVGVRLSSRGFASARPTITSMCSATVYDSAGEPDGVLLKACGTRRESRCPSCAATYRADAYQLLAAGLQGGKGVPETVAAHPRLFVTFTAPSFGQVHTRKAQGRLVLPCHPYRQGARCPHGQRAGCWYRHDEDDPRLGEPLCPGAVTTRRRRCSGTPWPPSCGGGPLSPSNVPWPGWSACRRGSCAGWSGCRTPRWPSSNAAGRSTSTPSSAWTRPPSAAARTACCHQRSRSPPTYSRTP